MKALNIEVQRHRRITQLRKRSGFTLIELMTVIAIMGMLGAISITTVRSAVQSAKETQTRTTIAKIDSVLTGIYEKYQYRRLKVEGNNYRIRAYSRVLKMRDLLRCDFPCCYDEVNTLSLDNVYTPLQSVYRAELGISDPTNPRPKPQPIDQDGRSIRPDDPRYADYLKEIQRLNAELLYLVIMNGDPEARASFSAREIADTDGNGNYEFVDGWGNPIQWMRWAPGLKISDRQPVISVDGFGNIVVDSNKVNADPFDPLGIIENMVSDPDGGLLPGWFLVPYVYSMGPDGESGLIPPDVFGNMMNDPFTYTRNNPNETAGSPVPQEWVDYLKSKDNIDNHTLVR